MIENLLTNITKNEAELNALLSTQKIPEELEVFIPINKKQY